jgi:hypothetical protein
MQLGECAFFVTLHLGFIILIDVWTHTDKQKGMKENLDPSKATLLHHHYKCSSLKKICFETMKFLIHKYTVISTLVLKR